MPAPMVCGDCDRVSTTVCVCCGGPLTHVLCLGDAPIANRLRSDPAEPVDRHPLHLARCRDCTTVQLVSRPAADLLFDEHYPYRSSQSRTMLTSAARLAEYLVRALGLGKGDLVAEVGSNDGYLLRQHMRHGVRVLGFDPAADAAKDAVEVGVTTEVVFFGRAVGEEHAGQAKVVHANNVLAHVDDPNDLLAGISAMLSPDGVAVIETPWLLAMLDAGAWDTAYGEHRFYWSAQALGLLLERHGLHVVHVEHLPELHGGTLRVFASHRPSWSLAFDHTVAAEARAGLADEGWAERYEVMHRGQVERLARWWEGVEPVAGYGAAAKGTMLLNGLGDVRPPVWVVDSTPGKQGKWMPCGALVLPPVELERRMPADCVVFPWNFADEIASKAAGYTQAGGRLWTLIPSVRRAG